MNPPGVIIFHSPPSTGRYIGSPSICILPGGDYVASHDLFGPASAEYETPVVKVYRSADKGVSWVQTAELKGQFWSNLFVHHGALYMMGTDKHYGNLVIRRSADHGSNWTDRYLIREGRFHTAPVPVTVHKGRLWRGVEVATGAAEQWAAMLGASVFSADENADLLKSSSWKHSDHLLDSTGWLEGNAVATREGEMWNMLRVHRPEDKEQEHAAIMKISEDGSTVAFDRFIPFPGGSKKFSIRYDAVSQLYWTIANYVPPAYRHIIQLDKVRNTQALCSSPDLLQWDLREIVLQHTDHEKHGFGYVDWQFEGDDIIFLSRTAFDANSFHEANYLTFHRIPQFRTIDKLNAK
jgi:hypothetical protein